MSKKLLIAVLSLGLLFTLSGAVNADAFKTGLSPVMKTNPDAARYDQLTDVPHNEPAFEKPIGDINVLSEAQTLLPPPYVCEYIDYSGGASAYFWTIPDAYGDDLFNMRFTPLEEYACTLLTAYIGVYPAAFVGTPDMDVIVWDDDGFGYPLNELGRVNVPHASLPTTTAYAVVDMSTADGGVPFVFTYDPYRNIYEEFHVGVTTTDQVSNVLAILSDDGSAGDLRSSENWNGFWGFMADDWGVDVNFLIGVDLCCGLVPFTDCYTQSYNCGVAYFWTQPDAYGDDYFNMRMSVEGPETLTNVGIALYAPSTVGTPDLDVFVWGSAGGFPDLGNVLYQTTVPNASLVFYPTYNDVDVSAANLVLRDEFHVGWSTDDVSGGTLAGLSDDGSCGELRSSEYWGSWGTMLNDWGVDVNFLIYADLCRDQFSECVTSAYYCNIAYFWRLPDVYGDIANAQKFTGIGLGCRLEDVRIALYDNGDPDIYTYNSEVQVWDPSGPGGVPGTQLNGITLTPADYSIFPAFTEVDFEPNNVIFEGDIWIGIESFAPTPETGIRTLSDDGSCGELRSVENWSGSWFYMLDDWGLDLNFLMEADFCCVPPPERPCDYFGPGEDWFTSDHDAQRTAASDNSDGQAREQQNLVWHYPGASPGIFYAKHVIYDGIVLVPYQDRIQALDLATGAPLWSLSGPTPYFSTAFRGGLTVKDGFVYFGAGSFPAFSRADVYTGTLDWTRNALSNPLPNGGNTLWAPSVIVNVGGTDVVIFTNANGAVMALNAADGTDFAGWATNPLLLDGACLMTLATNGSTIYVGTDGAGNGAGISGTLYAIDAATGSIVWTADDTVLKGEVIDDEGDGAPDLKEYFMGPIGVDFDGSLYAATGFPSGNEVNGPPSGVYYKFTSGGSVAWFKVGLASQVGGSGPVIDANSVYFTGVGNWLGEDEPYAAYSKNTGALIWEANSPDFSINTEMLLNGALECTLLEADRLYTASLDGRFPVIRTDDGLIEFEYNISVSPVGDNAAAVAVAPNGMVIMTTRWGDVFALADTDVDRPRLRILQSDVYKPVPFFSPASFPVTFEEIFMNNGPAALTGTLVADEVAPAAAYSVRPDRISRMSGLADEMVSNTYDNFAGKLVAVDDPLEFENSAYSKDTYSNTAAYAPPAWLNGFVGGPNFSLADGEKFDIVLDVNGPLVTRGPHPVFITIQSNDPAYFLDDPAASPYVELGVVGGCLEEFDTLFFGTSQQNFSVMYNSGKIAGNARDLGFQIQIDGEDEYFCYFAGYLIFARPELDADHRAVAAWTGGDAAELGDNIWETLLADPNCGGNCQTFIERNIILGYISNDGGQTYDPIMGEGAVYQFVDSVADYTTSGGGWDVDLETAPFDDTLTFGLKYQNTEYGAYGVDILNNFKIVKMDITNRNYPSTIDYPIYMGMWVDHDLGVGYGATEGYNYGTFFFLDDYDVAWGGACDGFDGVGLEENTNIWGAGTIGIDMLGVRTLEADFLSNTNWHTDSTAIWSQIPGASLQSPADACAESQHSDRQAYYSFAELDFSADETMTFGYYIFGYSGPATGNNYNTFDTSLIISTAVAAQQFAGFGRGDINDDGTVNLADVVALWNFVNGTGNGPLFQHLADVNADDNVDIADVQYLADWWFGIGPAPMGVWVLPDICPAP